MIVSEALNNSAADSGLDEVTGWAEAAPTVLILAEWISLDFDSKSFSAFSKVVVAIVKGFLAISADVTVPGSVDVIGFWGTAGAGEDVATWVTRPRKDLKAFRSFQEHFRAHVEHNGPQLFQQIFNLGRDCFPLSQYGEGGRVHDTFYNHFGLGKEN